MLLDAGADVNIKNNEGNTALELATSENVIELIKSYQASGNILLQQRIRVNITKTVSFSDPILLIDEDININDYIETNKDNIVIVYNKNKYFFTTRENIIKQKDDAIVFPCKTPDTMNPTNIISNRPLYDLKKIGLIAGFPCDMEEFFNNPKCQLFALINTSESYPSFVSDNVLNRGGSLISGLHCQAGQESKISYMIVAVPSIKDNPDTVQMGGMKQLKKNKKNKKKNTRRKINKKKNKKKTRKYKK
jgi:hypothetical protein